MEQESIPRASRTESLLFLIEVMLPNFGKGVIIRRPWVVKISEVFNIDVRAVRRLQKLRKKYGQGPVLINLPFRPVTVLLDPTQVNFVLDNTPEPFATAETLKKHALAHFQPKLSLISHGYKRQIRRKLQEDVLDTHQHAHRYAHYFIPIIDDEVAQLLKTVQSKNHQLDWDDFLATWEKIVRRIAFGDVASNDYEITASLKQLRKDANWSILKPKRFTRRRHFLNKVKEYLDIAEPGSLAHAMEKAHKPSGVAPAHQVPQWLFAYEPGGMAVFRTLALLATHPHQMEIVRQEIAQDKSGRVDLPYLRACILESLRLWPTTPLLLRQNTTQVQWPQGVAPANTSVVIFAPFFHRDKTHLPHADQFFPEHWRGKDVPADWPFVPFSGGTGRCPGEQLVLLTTSAMVAALLQNNLIKMESPNRLNPERALPGTLDNFSLRFSFKHIK